MKIGVNDKHEIIQINEITNPTLVQIEVDRERYFDSWNDEMILRYCFEDGIFPQSPQQFDNWEKLKLQQENTMLKTQVALQNTAIDEIFIMLPTLGV